jgi:dipeptidyl aminopeptidase/acylaminoacyl peptidase
MTMLRTASRVAALAAFSLLTCVQPASSATPQLAPMPVPEALTTKRLALYTSISASPDGRYIAYTVDDSARADRVPRPWNGNQLTETGALLVCYGCDVYVTDLETKETFSPSGSVGSSHYVSWSPDSKHIAFYSDRDGQMRVWTYELATRSLKRVSEAKALPNAYLPPQWSDRGRKLLVSLLPQNKTFEEVNRDVSAQPDPATTLPGSTVAVYSHEREPGGPSPKTQKMQGYDGFQKPLVKDLALLDIATGEAQRLVPGFDGTLRGVSADGRYALTTIQGRASTTNYNDTLFDIVVLDMTDGSVAMKLAEVPMVWGNSLSWAPSGHRFAYTSGARSELSWSSPYEEKKQRRFGDIFVVDVGGRAVNISAGDHPSFSGGDPPIWSADGRAIYVSAGDRVWRADVQKRTTRAVTQVDGQRRILKVLAVRDRTVLWQPRGAKTLFAQVSNTQTLHEEICTVDIATGAISPVLQKAQSYNDGGISTMRIEAANSTAPGVFEAQSATEPPELFETVDFSQVSRLTHLNAVFDKYVMGETRLVTWQGADGKEYKGSLLLPAGYREGQRYPLVVWQRPSNVGSMALNVFGLLPFTNMQILATRGYAVFYPDFPARSSRDVERVAKEVLFPGIDRVIELGVADKDRIGVTGASWGGYSTLALITFTDRFKVAVAESGPSNWFDAFTVMLRNGNAFRVQEASTDMGGTPWTARQNYIDASPFFHLDKVTTPVMLLHARDHGDYSIPQSQASQIFVGLRYLNQTVSLVIFDGGHGFGSSSFTDHTEIWNRVIGWYDRFLKSEKGS